MVQEKKETKVKAKVGKPPVAKKETAAKKEAPAKAAAPKVAPKKVASGGQIKVTQIGSPIARKGNQKATLIGLGLNKLHRSRVLGDTPQVRGMIRLVDHLVKVENVG